jgi:FlaA1/EpsC-like NDP-sugar epimerase
MQFINLSSHILNLPRMVKRAIAVAVDILLCAMTVALAYKLRLDVWILPVGNQWLSYLAAIIFAIPIFITSGLYRAIFRYVGWGALMTVVRACAIYGLIYSAVFTLIGVPLVPRSIGILQPILLFLVVGASRAIARYWLGGGYKALLRMGLRRRVLIYGAGSAGRQLAGGIASSEDMQVVAFVDDDKTLQGSVLNGKHIYESANIAELIERLAVTDVLLAIPSTSRQRRNEIIEDLRGSAAAVRTLPGLMDLTHGRVTVKDLRELDIEDLLGRDPVAPNEILLGKCIAGKCVLVTGAGGSIGSELCRQILALKPETLLLFDQSEYNLYAIHHELESRQEGTGIEIVPLLGSVQDEGRMASIMEALQPHTVYHAAAYKHVHLVESNPIEGIRNNVFGTLSMARLALKFGVRDFVLISTDKAVRPTNIMGATKRVAEQILQALAEQESGTRFSMVRFGNVLGSSGSVVPLFRKQISEGGPVTVTHEDITRYFMTIPEAAQLVIQAGAMATGGEVFVLDMGEPVKIVELARRMIELSGLRPRFADRADGDIGIEYVGLRPGEKLYEELLIGDNPTPTGHRRIMKARESFLKLDELDSVLAGMSNDLADHNIPALQRTLASLANATIVDGIVHDHVFGKVGNDGIRQQAEGSDISGDRVARND